MTEVPNLVHMMIIEPSPQVGKVMKNEIEDSELRKKHASRP